MKLPKELKNRLEIFNEQLEDYKHGKYNATQLRRVYHDPLIKALGSDMDNSQGFYQLNGLTVE